MTLLTVIQEHQTLTVGIIGFVGVIFTLWFNARQARAQRREERHHECQTLRAALIAEPKINKESLEANIDKIDDTRETGGYFVPTDPMNDAYRAFTDRIGLLSEAEVGKVMYVYLTLQTYHATLFLIGVPPHTGGRYVEVPAKSGSLLSGALKSMIGPIDEAIEVMERARAIA